MTNETLLGGIHDREGRAIAPPGSWVLDTINLSANQEPANYDAEVNWVGRLNWSYGSTGTIPTRDRYSEYAEAAADYVERSPGCHIWIVGNEPNLPREWPNNAPIYPADYAECYKMTRRTIKSVPGHEHDEVLVAGPGPWNAELKYSTNPKGDWIAYFVDVQLAIGVECDGFALHAYARGYYPEAVTSKDKMDWPFDNRFKGFLVYRDFCDAILPQLHHKPRYLTEVNGNGPWEAHGLIPAALREISNYNLTHDNGFRAVIFYRFPDYDDDIKFHMVGKADVLAEFADAIPRFKSPSTNGASSNASQSLYIPLAGKAEITPEIIAVSPPAKWDERLKARGVQIQPIAEPLSVGQTIWYAQELRWFSEAEAGGRHHIYVEALDENGTPLAGARFEAIWPSGKDDTKETNGRSGFDAGNMQMSPSLHEFSVRMLGAPSEMVTGIGMGADGNPNAHTSTLVIFRRAAIPVRVPAPVGDAPFERAYVVASIGAYVRSEPTTDSDILIGVPYREGVDVIGIDAQGLWLRVRYGGVEGWMRADLVSETKPAPLPTAPPTTKANVPLLAHPVSTPGYRVVTQAFGPSTIDYSQYKIDGVPLLGHNGVDFGTPVGTIIVAVDKGTVVEVADEGGIGYGKYIKLVHAWGETVYAHLYNPFVRVGDKVEKGEPIAASGNTGNSTGPHLHFGLRVNPYNRADGWGGYEDPIPYLLRQSTATSTAPSGLIDPITALAFLEVESRNQAFTNGLMTIRFEVHMFRVYLKDDALFNRYFKFAQGDYNEQYWRPSPDDAWLHAHGSMAQRYQLLAFARSLNEDAAFRATGMGLGQIMGSNYERIGYSMPLAMFRAFSHPVYGVNAQVFGFARYIQSDSKLLDALRTQDFKTAIRLYNGVGQEDVYMPLLRAAMDKIRGEVG